MAGHTEGAKEGLFCSLRTDECPCGNKYKDIMEGTESWGKYKQKHRTLTVVERSPEAHHVLPVASVTGNITANSKIRQEVVENTKWCVNEMSNMIALPLFEMTFTHYLIEHDPDAGIPIPPPPFAGLPMHNYGHAAFQKEVTEELEEIAEDALLLRSSDSLLEDPVFAPWRLPDEVVRPFAEKIKDLGESRLVVSQTARVERAGQIYREATVEIFTPELRQRYQRHLEEAALLLYLQGRQQEAKRALATAIDLEKEVSLFTEDTFILGLVKRSVAIEVGPEAEDAEGESRKEMTTESGLIIPR